jgi:hypothetical protein
MFYGSDNGGHTAAVLTSFIATCKHLRIDPFAYLRDILDRINAHPHDRLDDTRQMGRRTCCRSLLTTLLPQTRLHRTLKMESQDGYHLRCENSWRNSLCSLDTEAYNFVGLW